MFKKLKEDYKNFILAKSKIELLEKKVKLLTELNNALFITVSKCPSSYVDNVLNKQIKNTD